MFMTKTRTTIVTLAATLAMAVVPAASQAAVRPGLHVPPPVKTQTVAEFDVQAGSAGIPGYDDKKCESLADDVNTAGDIVVEEYDDGTPNSSRAKQAAEIGNKARAEMEDNCMVIL
jgi:hypothetical protein